MEERADSQRFDAGVCAKYQSCNPVTMRAGELQGDHASPAVSEEHDLMRVSIWQRVEHREGRFFQDHRCAATDTDVRRQHVRYLANGSLHLCYLSVGFVQRGQQHDRLIDAHVLKARVGAIRRRCTPRSHGLREGRKRMLRGALLRLSRSHKIKDLVTTAPVTSRVVERFIAGETSDRAVAVARRLIGLGLLATIDYLGEDTTERGQADTVVVAYLDLLTKLRESGLSSSAEVSIKLSALGLHLRDGPQLALENAELICHAARMADTAVTLDMEDHTTTDSTLEILHTLRKEYPGTGAVLQAYLYRTEGDCRDLAEAGSRVRLCKGAYAEPESVAFQDRQEIDKSYVRCMKILMVGSGIPMLATHDPTLIDIGLKLANDHSRAPKDFEFQMLYGIRPTEQQRLARLGHAVRVYMPYGTDWYGYLVRRLAERPSNLTFFARSLITKS
jgi:proline dehydrogenase